MWKWALDMAKISGLLFLLQFSLHLFCFFLNVVFKVMNRINIVKFTQLYFQEEVGGSIVIVNEQVFH